MASTLKFTHHAQAVYKSDHDKKGKTIFTVTSHVKMAAVSKLTHCEQAVNRAERDLKQYVNIY